MRHRETPPGRQRAVRALGARADDQDFAAVRTGKPARGEQAVTGGFPFGHEVKIYQSLERAVIICVKRHAAVHHRRPFGGVVGKDGGGFHR